MLCVVTVAALVATGCQRTPSDAPAPKATAPITVAAYYWPGMFWIDIANRKGWFREAGLDVRIVDTNADYYGSYQNVRDGTLDVQSFAMFDLMQINARGADLVGVLAGDSSVGAEKIVSRAGITRLTDLAGKSIALPRGTYLEYIFHAAAARVRLDTSRVKIVDVPGEKVAEALTAGRVDAMVAWEPYATQTLDALKGRVLFETSQIPNLDPQVYAMRRQFIQQRPDDVRKLLHVWQRTGEFIRTHPDEAFAIVAEVNHQPIEAVRELARLDRIFDLHDNELAFSFSTGVDSLHGSARKINDFLLANGVTRQPLDSAQFLDPSFVRELR
jgi:NitT/TauT family transport system substrate-binding protein